MDLPDEIVYAIVDVCDCVTSRLRAAQVNRRLYENRLHHLVNLISSISREVAAALGDLQRDRRIMIPVLALYENVYQRVRYDDYFTHNWRKYYLRPVDNGYERRCICDQMVSILQNADSSVFQTYDVYRSAVPRVYIETVSTTSFRDKVATELRVFCDFVIELNKIWHLQSNKGGDSKLLLLEPDPSAVSCYVEFSHYAWQCAIPRRRTTASAPPACGITCVGFNATIWYENVDEMLFHGVFYYYHTIWSQVRDARFREKLTRVVDGEFELFKKWTWAAYVHATPPRNCGAQYQFHSIATVAALEWEQLLVDIRELAIAIANNAFVTNFTSEDRLEYAAAFLFDVISLGLWIHPDERSWMESAESHPIFRIK